VKLPVRYRIQYTIDGTVLDGEVTQRQYAVATPEIVMRFETDRDLHFPLFPDLAEYAAHGDTLELLVPLLSASWFEVPIRLSENPRLKQACETGEITLRLMSSSGECLLRASDMRSQRWRSPNPESWRPPAIRDRLLIQLGRDGVPHPHPGAAKVRPIQEAESSERLIVLHKLRLPERSTCVFCGHGAAVSREHAVPDWARRSGDIGITVRACVPCNNGLSKLEEDVADICRRGPSELSAGERFIAAVWAIKTIWVLGRALDIDPLQGAGEELVSRLTRAAPPAAIGPNSIREIYSSFEISASVNFLRYTDDWVMLCVANLVTSVWFDHG
jgi:hypothetical protein